MSINKNEIEKSFEGFSSDIIQKTNLFFKSFKELTKENLDNYLDCLGLLDIWNSEEEKLFLWNTFYKYNINGKIIESSVLKGMKEILSKDEIKESFNSFKDKNQNYSRDSNINIIRLSFNRVRSTSIMKSSLDKNFDEEEKDDIYDKNLENLKNYIDNCDIKKLKQIRNIMILLSYNNFDIHNFCVKLTEINEIFEKYPLLKIPIEDFLKYLSFISEKHLRLSNKEEEFNINEDSYNLSLKLIENKLKKYEKEGKENTFNENLNINGSNPNNISDSNISNSNNNLEDNIKNCIQYMININEELKFNIKILKDIENSMKKCYQNIINNFKNLLSLKDFESSNENIIKITDNDDNNDELKINIENNISYMNKKYEEIEIFFLEIDNNIIQKEIQIKNLSLIIDRLIEKKINLENEKKYLLSNKKETEKNINIQFNEADEEISKLSEEKSILKNKISELLEQIENLKINNKYNLERIKELENDLDIKIKEIKDKSNEIYQLKLENKNYKNKYDSLLNEVIQMNNKKENQLKNYENELIQKALINISKRIQTKDIFKKYINYNIEQLFEEYFKLEEKNNINNINLEEKEKLILEKNKKIKQLETDLEMYREKTLLLSQEIKNLQSNKNDNDKNLSINNSIDNINNINNETSERNTCILEDLLNSKSSNKIEENKNDKNNFTIFNNDNYFTNDNKEQKDLPIIQQTNSGNLFAPPCLTNNIENLLINNSVDNEQKLFSNIETPNENEIKNSIKEVKNIQYKDRPSNPYLYDNNDNDNDRESNPYNKNLFEINKNENLNINDESFKNNEQPQQENKIQNIINISQSNNLLNQNVEKYLSLKDMEELILKNYENKLNIPSYDYLHLFTNEKIKEISAKIGEEYKKEDIFSDIIYLLDKYEQLYKNIIFITKKCLYIIEPESYKIKYTFVRSILIRLTLSSINCNIIVLHFITGNDLVFMTLRRPELISYFINTEKKSIERKYDMQFGYADEFNIKRDGDYYYQKIKNAMNSTTFNFQTAIKLGYLIKINEGYIFTQYHEKLVVLTDFGLFYFDNPTVAPKKLISVIGAEINDLKNKFGENLFCFEIITMNKYKIIFGTYCKEEYEDWIQKLKDIQKKYENKKV